MSPEIKTSDGQTILLATFRVHGTLCALDAGGLQEVIRLGPVKPVRDAPEEVIGIISLRGRIVTLVDLGPRLEFPKTVTGPQSRIVIIEDGGEFIALLDKVEVERDHWQAPPPNASWEQARFFKGVCCARGRVITLLDSGRILAEKG